MKKDIQEIYIFLDGFKEVTFVEQDFYFEESNPRKTKLVIFGLILLFIIAVVCYFLVRNKYTLNIKRNLKFEVGSVLSTDIRDYVNNKVLDENDYSLILSSVQQEDGILTKTGEYSFKIKYKNVTKTGHLKVIDTVAPKVEVAELTVGIGEDFDGDDFIVSCEDYSKPCKVDYVDTNDAGPYKEEGTYNFQISISDNASNVVKKDVTLIVKKDYNSNVQKEKDLKADYIIPNFDDWNNEMIIKFEKGYDPNSIDDTDAYSKLMEVSGEDLHKYIDPLYVNNLITDSQIIEVYNKYGLVIGYAIRVKLDNGLVLYCQNN